MFAKGHSGRPRGSRDKLSRAFIEALAADFNEHGVGIIRLVRAEHPDTYLKIIAALVPKELEISQNPLGNYSDEQLEAFLTFVCGQLGISREPEEGEGETIN